MTADRSLTCTQALLGYASAAAAERIRHGLAGCYRVAARGQRASQTENIAQHTLSYPMPVFLAALAVGCLWGRHQAELINTQGEFMEKMCSPAQGSGHSSGADSG